MWPRWAFGSCATAGRKAGALRAGVPERPPASVAVSRHPGGVRGGPRQAGRGAAARRDRVAGGSFDPPAVRCPTHDVPGVRREECRGIRRPRAGRSARMSLRNKTIVVTGGSRGLGLGLVEALVDRGAKVTVVARDQAALAAVQQRLGVAVIPADVTDEGAAQRILADVRPEVLALNAGVRGSSIS